MDEADGSEGMTGLHPHSASPLDPGYLEGRDCVWSSRRPGLGAGLALRAAQKCLASCINEEHPWGPEQSLRVPWAWGYPLPSASVGPVGRVCL